MIVSTAALCLALNIYMEARSEPIMGQYAVAMVTLNRVRHRDSSVCQEVFRRKQFSWANGRVTRIRGGWKLEDSVVITDSYAWWVASRVSAMSLAGKMPDFTQNSTFYHTRSVKPVWRHALTRTRSIGNHIFYTSKA